MKITILITFLLIVFQLNSQNYQPRTAGQPTGSSQEVGITNGNLSVSLTGGANYQVPIEVSPGINGVEPQVALTYNSQSGNGIAGYGWNISGISAITRIPSTKFHDGIIDGVDFDNNDRFSLDGQRLILKSGTYGGDNAVYETENFSNIKIVSYGVDGSGPSYFKVFLPNGNVVSYGSSSDSKNGNTWSIRQLITPQDIRVTYYYTKEYNSLLIYRIDYGRRATHAALNRVSFIYKERTRNEQAYIGGSSYKVSKILSQIKVYSNNSGFRNYYLEHNTTSLNYERLTKITEKSGDNSKSYNPTLFVYDDTTNNDLFEPTQSTMNLTNVNALNTGYISGDFNGDAKMDFIAYPKTGSSSKKKYWLFTDIDKNGTNNPDEINVGLFQDIFPVTWLTHNNKMLTEQGWAVIQNSSNNEVKFKVFSTGIVNPVYSQYEKTWNAPTYATRYSCEIPASTYNVPLKYISGDFNGDGLTDVIAIAKPYSYSSCYTLPPSECDGGGFPTPLSTPETNQSINSTSESNAKNPNDLNASPNRIAPIDDNCCECNTVSVSNSRVYFIDLNRNKTSNFVNVAGYLNYGISNSDSNYDIQVGDFDGDGKSDFIVIQQDKIVVYTLNNNNGITVLATITNDTDIDTDKPHLLGDYNGDGKIDVVMPTNVNQDRWAFYFSKGNGFQKKVGSIGVYYALPKILGSNGRQDFYYIPNDINSDGKTDIIYVNNRAYEPTQSGQFTNFKVLENITTNPSTISFNVISDALGNNGDIGVGKTPLPIFLNQNNLNQNLEFALLSSSKIHHFKHTKDNRQDVLLREITTGNGVVETIHYKPLIPESNYIDEIQIYNATTNEVYPNVDIQTLPSTQVVSKLEKQSIGQNSKQVFSYYNAVSNVEGLGFLGFKAILRTNWYNNDHAAISNVTKNDISQRGANYESYSSLGIQHNFQNTPSTFISKILNNYTSNLSSTKVFKIANNSSTSHNGLQNTSVSTTITYDTYNNPIESTSVTKEGGATQQTTTTNIEYDHNPTGGSSQTNPYFIGRVKKQEKYISAGGDVFSTEEQFTYNNSMLLTQIKRKGNNTDYITENYTNDVFGNVTQKTITAGGITRITKFEYDSSHRFLTKEIDVENLETIYQYDTNGYLLQETNPYGLITQYQNDVWGKRIGETDYLGNQTNIVYSRIGAETQFYINNSDGSKRYKKFDDLGREILVGSYGFESKWDYVQTSYDIYGRTISVSEPFNGGASQFNTYIYDDYGRLTQTNSATGKTTNISYNGLTATASDGYKTVSTTKNSIGQVVRVIDDGGTINYTYFANRKLKQSNLSGTLTSMEYDGWGNKTKLTDPSAGVYEYQYNALGETTKEITPKGTTTYTLNPSTGKLTRKQVQGDDTFLISDYIYDGTTKLLKSIATNNGATYNYDYDNYERLNKTTENNTYAIFEHSLTYDSFGRVNTERYKATNASDSKISDVTIKKIYKNGQLHKILDNATQNELWRVNSLNERKQVKSLTYGNNITEITTYNSFGLPTSITSEINNTDIIDLDYTLNSQRGLIMSRTSSFFGTTENFQYDHLSRLTTYTNVSGNQETQNYDTRGRITKNPIGDFAYTNSSKPYQNTSIDLSGTHSLYDNGKDYQSISYNAFKAPVKITVGKSTTTSAEISFEYNIFQQRTAAQYKNITSGQEEHYKTKAYSWDGAMEITRNTATNQTEFVTYIAGDAYAAPVVYKSNGNTGEFLYLHKDYLGSIIAISNQAGTLVEKRHFDAWGNLAIIKDQNGNDLDELTVLDRGYTGHEHLASVGLINMNARLYDAQLHRFLGPDNFVQDPYNTQSYNRYGYVLNNPLSYVDQDGEFVFTAFLIGAAIAMAIDYGIQVAVNYAQGYKGSDAWFNKVDFFDVAVSGVIGGLTAGYGAATQVGKFGTFLLKNQTLVSSIGVVATSAVDITGEGVQPVTFDQFGQRVVTGIATQYATKAVVKAFSKNYHPDVEVDGQKYKILPHDDPRLENISPMKSTAKLGRDIHKQYKFLDNLDDLQFEKEYSKIGGIRPDAIDFKNKIIYELKPYNLPAINLGQKQLLRYQSFFDNGFKLKLDVYFKD